MLRIITTFAVAGAVLPAAQGIVVAPDSPCSTSCGNVLTATSQDDITCDVDATGAGGSSDVFQGCLQCEMTSGYSKGDQSDTEWMLYNFRYAAGYCLWGAPNNISSPLGDSPCTTSKACANFQDSILYKNLSTEIDSFDYCDSWPIDDDLDYKGCRECLQASQFNSLANFFTVLQAGCEQKPKPGITVAVAGQVFSTDNVNVTAPTPTATVNPAWFDHGPLGLGGKVGIAVGGLVLILSIAGFCIVWNGKRRRRAYLRSLEGKQGFKGWPSPQQHQGEMRETPVSQRPLRGWDDSPMSAYTDSTFPRYFSPYSSQYNSPVSAQDAPNMPWPTAGMPGAQNIGVALSEHHDNGARSWEAYSPDTKGKGHGQESYEMQNVDSAGGGKPRQYRPEPHEPPVLGHPGYGRNSDSPPRQYSLDEHDARAGYAI